MDELGFMGNSRILTILSLNYKRDDLTRINPFAIQRPWVETLSYVCSSSSSIIDQLASCPGPRSPGSTWMPTTTWCTPRAPPTWTAWTRRPWRSSMTTGAASRPSILLWPASWEYHSLSFGLSTCLEMEAFATFSSRLRVCELHPTFLS